MTVGTERPALPEATAPGSNASFQPDERQRFFDFQRQVRALLAVVRSIVRRMAETSGSVEEFAAHLEGRLGALGRIQGFLLRAPETSVDLEELVRAEFLAQAVADEQFEINGPRILLTAKEAGTLGLALHELATNSLKFGALSHPRGRIRVDWKRSAEVPPSAVFEWSERTENVIAAATHRGFGFELIEHTLPYELGGTSSIVLHPNGLRCSISFVIPAHD